MPERIRRLAGRLAALGATTNVGDATRDGIGCQHVTRLSLELWRDDEPNRLPDRLGRCVFESLLGRTIPRGSRPRQVIRNDGAVSRCSGSERKRRIAKKLRGHLSCQDVNVQYAARLERQRLTRRE
jgi:hypothetical protein